MWFQNRRMKWRHTKETEKVTTFSEDCSIDNKKSDNSLLLTMHKDKTTRSSDDEDIDVESDVL